MSKPTKIDQIKDHLISGKSLTQLEALGLYGAFRLAARVHELKKKGWNIKTEIKKDPNGNEYAEYHLGDPPNLNPHGLPDFALPPFRGPATDTTPPLNVDDFRS